MGSSSVHIKQAAAKEIEALPRRDRARIVACIRDLSDDPRGPASTKLSGRPAYRIRQGNFRVVYTIDDEERVVMVVVVAHRRDAYR